MKTITEWMIEDGIAENGFSAGHIATGLKLYGLEREEQEARCRLYRAWRPKPDKKDMIPTYQAYDLSIAGIDPADVEVRQVDMFAETDWISEIAKVKKYVEREPELVALMVRDWQITKDANLTDLAWAMTRENVWKKDAEFLLEKLESYVITKLEPL